MWGRGKRQPKGHKSQVFGRLKGCVYLNRLRIKGISSKMQTNLKLFLIGEPVCKHSLQECSNDIDWSDQFDFGLNFNRSGWEFKKLIWNIWAIQKASFGWHLETLGESFVVEKPNKLNKSIDVTSYLCAEHAILFKKGFRNGVSFFKS